jgi:hypothetical protein
MNWYFSRWWLVILVHVVYLQSRLSTLQVNEYSRQKIKPVNSVSHNYCLPKIIQEFYQDLRYCKTKFSQILLKQKCNPIILLSATCCMKKKSFKIFKHILYIPVSNYIFHLFVNTVSWFFVSGFLGCEPALTLSLPVVANIAGILYQDHIKT